ncbi:MAG: hypothetical protein J5612_04010 [Paludibacteraceae bacterium]|nr:hypothetical protein [Paludibacteraceae bacterium]
MKKSTFLVVLLTIFCGTLVAANCDPINITWLQTGKTNWGDMRTTDSDIWSYNSSYGAKANATGSGEGWLLTPEQNLEHAEVVNLSFYHVNRNANNPESDFTLWVTDNYTGNVGTTEWKQLTISPYSTNTDWNFVTVSIEVPTGYVGAKTVFGFKYVCTSANATWEIKALKLYATFDCEREELRVCGQNLRNYYYNYSTSSRPEYHDDAGRATKTYKIMDGMFAVNADIYAFCELEAKPIILKQLVDSLNKKVGKTRYDYVVEDIDEDPGSYDNNLKSGFVYRVDKVKTIGESSAASTYAYYKQTMRIQAFEELSSGERFVLSMNHFKAKDSSEDAGDQQRQNNANNLVSALKKVSVDPDILILGDLNCTITETPLTIIKNAGYEEQLLRFDENTWSHCYSSTGELIDHAFANASMAKQVVDAQVKHICTTCNGYSGNYYASYSDHDPYYVDLLLSSGECEDVDKTYLQTGGSSLGEMKNPQTISGVYNKWQYNSSYGAVCKTKGNPHWLHTPVYNLEGAKSATVEFEHALNFANVSDMTTQQTMWITPNFSDVTSSTWTQLTIPNYPSGSNWTFVSTKVDIPTNLLGKHTVIAFKYDVPEEGSNTPNWEIKNLHIKASCSDITSMEESVQSHKSDAIRLIEDGRLVILLPDGSKYDMRGTRLQ